MKVLKKSAYLVIFILFFMHAPAMQAAEGERFEAEADTGSAAEYLQCRQLYTVKLHYKNRDTNRSSDVLVYASFNEELQKYFIVCESEDPTCTDASRRCQKMRDDPKLAEQISTAGFNKKSVNRFRASQFSNQNLFRKFVSFFSRNYPVNLNTLLPATESETPDEFSPEKYQEGVADNRTTGSIQEDSKKAAKKSGIDSEYSENSSQFADQEEGSGNLTNQTLSDAFWGTGLTLGALTAGGIMVGIPFRRGPVETPSRGNPLNPPDFSRFYDPDKYRPNLAEAHKLVKIHISERMEHLTRMVKEGSKDQMVSVTFPGSSESNHALGTGLAQGQWISYAVGHGKKSSDGQNTANQLVHHTSSEILKFTSNFRGNPRVQIHFGWVDQKSADAPGMNVQVWGANAGNWNHPPGYSSNAGFGGGQAAKFTKQTPNVFGIVTTPLSGLQGLTAEQNRKTAREALKKMYPGEILPADAIKALLKEITQNYRSVPWALYKGFLDISGVKVQDNTFSEENLKKIEILFKSVYLKTDSDSLNRIFADQAP